MQGGGRLAGGRQAAAAAHRQRRLAPGRRPPGPPGRAALCGLCQGRARCPSRGPGAAGEHVMAVNALAAPAAPRRPRTNSSIALQARRARRAGVFPCCPAIPRWAVVATDCAPVGSVALPGGSVTRRGGGGRAQRDEWGARRGGRATRAAEPMQGAQRAKHVRRRRICAETTAGSSPACQAAQASLPVWCPQPARAVAAPTRGNCHALCTHTGHRAAAAALPALLRPCCLDPEPHAGKLCYFTCSPCRPCSSAARNGSLRDGCHACMMAQEDLARLIGRKMCLYP